MLVILQAPSSQIKTARSGRNIITFRYLLPRGAPNAFTINDLPPPSAPNVIKLSPASLSHNTDEVSRSRMSSMTLDVFRAPIVIFDNKSFFTIFDTTNLRTACPFYFLQNCIEDQIPKTDVNNLNVFILSTNIEVDSYSYNTFSNLQETEPKINADISISPEDVQERIISAYVS